MTFNLERAAVVPISECAMRIAHTGKVYGEPEEDSAGRAMVFGEVGNYFAGYYTNGSYVIDMETSYGLLSQAAEAAVQFTRYACVAKG